jgi:phage terminase Nu1 subunit (DNA packaging protein)
VQTWYAKGCPNTDPARLKWIIKHLDEQRKKSATNSLAAQKQEEEIALLKERRQRESLKRRKETGQLVERKIAVGKFRRMITEAKVQLETIPSLVAQFVPEGDTRAVVFEECRKVVGDALRSLAGKHGSSGES